MIIIVDRWDTPVCKKCFSTKVRPLSIFEGTALFGVAFYESTTEGIKKIEETQVEKYICEDCGCRMGFRKQKKEEGNNESKESQEKNNEGKEKEN